METLARDPANSVVHLSQTGNIAGLPGVRRLSYPAAAPLPAGVPPYLHKMHASVCAATEVASLLPKLRAEGFVPDITVAYGGRGVGTFVKDVYPERAVLGHFEWYSNARGFEYGFDPAHALTAENEMALRMQNAELLVDLAAFDHGVTPTGWQRSTFPPEFREKLSVIHDGIDTDFFTPGASKGEEIVTYVSRGLEPVRGFHQFAAAAQKILAARPKCRIVVVGEGSQVFYSRKAPGGRSWREVVLEKFPLDPARVHFTGWLQRREYREVLRASSAHVYLTVPYVLSWSLLEAMSAGCLVVGSRTPPVEEAIAHRENGLLADYFSAQSIADAVCEALEGGAPMQALRQRARETVLERYAYERVVPQHIELMQRLSGR